MSECEPIQETTIIQKEVDAIGVLQHAFNKAIGVELQGKELTNRSYNPVIDRWHIEEAWKNPDKKSPQDVINTIRENIHTNLMERMFAVESQSKFLIRTEIVEGKEYKKLYSELLPNESFGQVILRGATWRATHGSKETEREGDLGELGGWLKINKALVDGKVGTKVISLSPPGIADESAYDGKYVDIYEVLEEGVIQRSRIAVDFEYQGTSDKPGYDTIARILDPHFFDEYDGRPLDAWYLSRPVVIEGDLPDLLLPKTAMSKNDFASLYEKIQKTRLIDYYIQVVTRPEIDWRELAKTFNTILQVADKLNEGESLAQVNEVSLRRGIDYSYDGMRMNMAVGLVNALGTRRVKQVGGGGCPPNRGIDFGDGLTTTLSVYDGAELIKDVLANSPGLFGFNLEETTWEYHTGSCVVCNAKETDVGPCNICKDCEKKF